jgi:hypothetical protein
MKREYIITSSARTMLARPSGNKIYHLVFTADQSQIQDINKLVHQSKLAGYHAYKIAEEISAGKDLLFTSRILVELQFYEKTDALTVSELLQEQGLHPQIMDDVRAEGKTVAFAKGDRFSNSAL